MNEPQRPTLLQRLSCDEVAELAAYFHTLERRASAERHRAALAGKRERGEAYTCAPFGWSRAGDAFVEDPSEQAVLSEILELRRAGLSCYGIAATLNDRRVPSRGRRWYEQSVRNVVRGADARAARGGRR